MAYSFRRLAKAHALFQREASDFWHPQMTEPYYLRNRVSKGARAVASWHDNERDEDYDPVTESAQKRKHSLYSVDDSEYSPSKKLKITSPTSRHPSKSNRDNNTNSPDVNADSHGEDDKNDSDSPNLSSSESNEPDSWDTYWAVSPTTEATESRYSFRSRGKHEASKNLTTDVTAPASVGSSGLCSHTQLTKKEDPLRTCTACQGLGLICSLATNPNPLAYPCAECALDGIECEVIPEPEWKRSCEGCRSRHGEVCSYRYADYDHSQPCQPCIKRGFKCVAGPAKVRSLVLQSDGTTSSEGSVPPTLHTRQLRSSDTTETRPIEVIAISDDESDYKAPSGANSVIYIPDSPSSEVSSDFYWDE